MDSDLHWLVRMNQSVRHIKQYCKRGYGSFSDSIQRQHAVLWNLELISLASRHLPKAFRERYHEVDWERLDHLCKFVIGDPWEVKRESVWRYVDEELPQLEHQIRNVLTECQMK